MSRYRDPDASAKITASYDNTCGLEPTVNLEKLRIGALIIVIRKTEPLQQFLLGNQMSKRQKTRQKDLALADEEMKLVAESEKQAEQEKMLKQAQRDEEFAEKTQHRFNVKKVRPDGNCGFRAASVHIYGKENQFSKLRNQVVQEMRQNKQVWENRWLASGLKKGENDNAAQLYRTFDQYIDNMAKPFIYNNVFELEVIAHLHKHRFEIYTLFGEITDGPRTVESQWTKDKNLPLFYYKYVDEHYDHLQPKVKVPVQQTIQWQKTKIDKSKEVIGQQQRQQDEQILFGKQSQGLAGAKINCASNEKSKQDQAGSDVDTKQSKSGEDASNYSQKAKNDGTQANPDGRSPNQKMYYHPDEQQNDSAIQEEKDREVKEKQDQLRLIQEEKDREVKEKHDQLRLIQEEKDREVKEKQDRLRFIQEAAEKQMKADGGEAAALEKKMEDAQEKEAVNLDKETGVQLDPKQIGTLIETMKNILDLVKKHDQDCNQGQQLFAKLTGNKKSYRLLFSRRIDIDEGENNKRKSQVSVDDLRQSIQIEAAHQTDEKKQKKEKKKKLKLRAFEQDAQDIIDVVLKKSYPVCLACIKTMTLKEKFIYCDSHVKHRTSLLGGDGPARKCIDEYWKKQDATRRKSYSQAKCNLEKEIIFQLEYQIDGASIRDEYQKYNELATAYVWLKLAGRVEEFSGISKKDAKNDKKVQRIALLIKNAIAASTTHRLLQKKTWAHPLKMDQDGNLTADFWDEWQLNSDKAF